MSRKAREKKRQRLAQKRDQRKKGKQANYRTDRWHERKKGQHLDSYSQWAQEVRDVMRECPYVRQVVKKSMYLYAEGFENAEQEAQYRLEKDMSGVHFDFPAVGSRLIPYDGNFSAGLQDAVEDMYAELGVPVPRRPSGFRKII